jgi:hypothetical protein
MYRKEIGKSKCEICGSVFDKSKGSVILIKDGEIGICPLCHDDVFKDGLRYNVDVMIVPVSEESLKLAAENGVYICPSRYISRKLPKFIAFYRGAKIGAITNIAKVIDTASRVSRQKVCAFARVTTDSDWINEDRFEIFELGPLATLKFKLIKDHCAPVQSRFYRSFRQFAQARMLKDLYGPSRISSELRRK